MNILSAILERSREVDERFARMENAQLGDVRIRYRVPENHPRRSRRKFYDLTTARFEDCRLDDHRRILLASAVKSHGCGGRLAEYAKENSVLVLESVEGTVKTKDYLDSFCEQLMAERRPESLVVVGGGLLLNVGAYLAEQMECELILYPTTLLSMADGAGGKVRVNAVLFGRAYKHFYKSYYEPDAIMVDPGFLKTLPAKERRLGLVEIIKHGLFQSRALLRFVVGAGPQLLANDLGLLKAALWAADLKRVCLDLDSEENENGSRSILRAGHDFSDRIEEDSLFTIPHGWAVALGILMLLKSAGREREYCEASEIFGTFRIPRSLSELEGEGRGQVRAPNKAPASPLTPGLPLPVHSAPGL